MRAALSFVRGKSGLVDGNWLSFERAIAHTNDDFAIFSVFHEQTLNGNVVPDGYCSNHGVPSQLLARFCLPYFAQVSRNFLLQSI